MLTVMRCTISRHACMSREHSHRCTVHTLRCCLLPASTRASEALRPWDDDGPTTADPHAMTARDHDEGEGAGCVCRRCCSRRA